MSENQNDEIAVFTVNKKNGGSVKFGVESVAPLLSEVKKYVQCMEMNFPEQHAAVMDAMKEDRDNNYDDGDLCAAYHLFIFAICQD